MFLDLDDDGVDRFFQRLHAVESTFPNHSNDFSGKNSLSSNNEQDVGIIDLHPKKQSGYDTYRQMLFGDNDGELRKGFILCGSPQKDYEVICKMLKSPYCDAQVLSEATSIYNLAFSDEEHANIKSLIDSHQHKAHGLRVATTNTPKAIKDNGALYAKALELNTLIKS